MSEPSYVRVISLVLALSVFTGGWLLLEYSQRLPQQAPLTEQPSETTQENVLPPERTVSQPPKVARPVSPAPPKSLITTFKCEQGGGRVSYSDQPCTNGAKTLAVTAEKEIQAPNPTISLQEMKARAAVMEAERLARERQFEIAATGTAMSTGSTADSKVRECENIDKEIAYADAKLRQPHSAREGDDWTAERRKLTDRRFSLGC